MVVSSDQSQNSAKMVVERVSDRDIKMRGLKVLLDGNYLTDLSFGNRVEVQVESGPHIVRVTNNLYSSQLEFDAVAGGVSKFGAGNVMRGLGALMFVVMGIGPYRTFLERDESA